MDQRPDPAAPIRDLLAGAERLAQEQIARVLSERLRELAPAIAGTVRAQCLAEQAGRVEEARARTARDLTSLFARTFDRMREYRSDQDWCDALLDCAGRFSYVVAFFSIRGSALCFQGARGVPEGKGNGVPEELPLADAGAFASVANTARPEYAGRTARELTPELAELFGGADESQRAILCPIVAGGRVAGVLYTEEPAGLSALEMVAAVASAALENHLLKEEASLAGPARGRVRTLPAGGNEPALPAAEPPVLPPHYAAAKRFAMVEVARLILFRRDAVRRGREQRSLYAELRTEIDQTREKYAREHAGAPDFLHEEMVGKLALHQPELMGPGYPGGRE